MFRRDFLFAEEPLYFMNTRMPECSTCFCAIRFLRRMVGQEGIEPSTSGFSDQRSYQTELPSHMAEGVGIEPDDTGVKVPCLTAWRTLSVNYFFFLISLAALMARYLAFL